MTEPWKPQFYQLNAVKFLLKNNGAGLFLDPGLGKTSITLAAFKVLQKAGHARRALVLAPLRPAYSVWPAEIDKWAEFAHLRWSLLHGKDKEDRLEDDADVFVINYDGLLWLMQEKRFQKLSVDTLIVDESSKMRHTNTRRYKLLRPALPTFERRWILTGTPAPNGYLDLFGQIYILDLGRSLGKFVTHYRQNFFYQSGFGGYDWKIQEGAEIEIQKRIKHQVMRLNAADYIKMPALLPPNVIRVTLPPAARKIYDDLEEEMIAELQSKRSVTAVSAGALTTKCAQLANGGVYHMPEVYPFPQPVPNGHGSIKTGMATVTLGGKGWETVHDAKMEALLDLIDELQGAQLLIAYEFQHDVKRIEKALPQHLLLHGALPCIGGGTTPKQSMEIERAWNAGAIQVMAVHPASAAHGLNLQESNAHHVCWFGLTWDLEFYDQLIARLRRRGNKAQHIHNHIIAASNTVDEVKLQALRRKDKTQTALLDALRTYIKERPRKGKIVTR